MKQLNSHIVLVTNM